MTPFLIILNEDTGAILQRVLSVEVWKMWMGSLSHLCEMAIIRKRGVLPSPLFLVGGGWYLWGQKWTMGRSQGKYSGLEPQKWCSILERTWAEMSTPSLLCPHLGSSVKYSGAWVVHFISSGVGSVTWRIWDLAQRKSVHHPSSTILQFYN